ncbi:Crp/Fnr family transcriptional regulator [Azorhizobium oxalatiphilum]|nr:Crp/Fnr family transcriptional regulator [Azorhizobium oxalatiphilum]
MSHVVRKLSARFPLNPVDANAVLDVPASLRWHEPGTHLVREGEEPRDYCSMVVSGLALRQKTTSSGQRQIISIHVCGDFLDAQHLFLERADHTVEALTRLRVVEFSRTSLRAVALSRPNVGRALWTEALSEASIFREWVLNVGARKAPARVAHLLCEIALRFEGAGLGSRDAFHIPMSQEQIGDAVGLTPVHVNRTLKGLSADGLIERDGRSIRIRNWERLQTAADFNPLYLHLQETTRDQFTPLKAGA